MRVPSTPVKDTPLGCSACFPNFSLERYALGVYNELCMALGGLVEE